MFRLIFLIVYLEIVYLGIVKSVGSPPSPKPTTRPPTRPPTNFPTIYPTNSPTFIPTNSPTLEPTLTPNFSPTKEPTIEPTFIPTNLPNCLIPGNYLNIGNSLTSLNGLYTLNIEDYGDICVYNSSDPSHGSGAGGKRWCHGWITPSAEKLDLNIANYFGGIKTNGIYYWAPHNPMTSPLLGISYAIIENNANFIIYNDTIVWSCFRGTFTYPFMTKCPIETLEESTGDICV